jgi:diguanylate cyclase (GGDEF)-like protein/PAS domain S-box-containing protein
MTMGGDRSMPPPTLAMHRRVVTDDVMRMHVHLLIAAAVILGAEIVGLALGWDAITQVRSGWPRIYPYTVAGTVAVVIAMALFRFGGRTARWIGIALAGVTVALAAGVDMAVNAGILPSSETSTTPHATWVTALPSVAATGAALGVLLIPVANPLVARIRFWLAAASGLVMLLLVLSYLYGSDKLVFGLGTRGTSLPSAILGLVIVGAIMTARSDQPPLAALDQRYDRNLLRRIVPMLIVAPFVPAAIAWLVSLVEPDAATDAAISSLVTVVILVAVIAFMGGGQSRAGRELLTQRQRVWDAFEHTPAATAVVTLDGRITTANVALARLTGRAEAELLGTAVTDLVADADHRQVAEALAEVAAGRNGFRRDVRFRGQTSMSIWVDLNVAPVRDSAGRVVYLILQCADLTDRKHLERVLADQAVRDPLTGLLNREGLTRQIDTLRETRGRAQDAVVVYADVDDLKALNDATGHAAGDDLLREVARRLRSCTREEDIVARIGGDEFVIVTSLPATTPGGADSVVDRLRRELSGPVAVGRDLIPLSVSLGASALNDFADTSAALARADKAMYADKELRRRATDRSEDAELPVAADSPPTSR